MEYLLHNGKIVRESEFHPGSLWRDDLLQVKLDLWFAHGELPLFREQMEKLSAMLKQLAWPGNPGTADQQELLRLIKRLINKNKAFMGGWVNCRFLFPDGKLQWVITVKPHPERLFPLDMNGKMGAISPFAKASGASLAPFSFFSEPLWKTEKLRSPHTEGIFLNDKGFVTEADNANLFFIRKDVMITPSPETGCFIDIMRSYILKTGTRMGFRVQESAVKPEEMTGMEEIFTVSEGNGFRWLRGIGEKRYMKTATELIWRQVIISCFSGVS